MTVFWVVAPCNLIIALMMEAARISETLVKLYQTTRQYSPEDSHLHAHHREILKFYLIIVLVPVLSLIKLNASCYYRLLAGTA
jgi:hypothetical protein